MIKTTFTNDDNGVYDWVWYLQGLGGGRGPLQLQGEHAGAEGQGVVLQPLAQHRQQEGRLRQRVGGHLRLPAGRHLALLPLDGRTDG